MKWKYALLVLFIAFSFCSCGNEPVPPPDKPVKTKQSVQKRQPPAVKEQQPTEETGRETEGGDQTTLPGNQPPVIDSVVLRPGPDGGMTVEVKSHDPENDPVHYYYEWEVNGEKVSEKDSIPSIKKKDVVQLQITPNDGYQDGKPGKVMTVVKNTAPVVTRNKEMNISPEGMVKYQILASDPDGDPLQYSLIDSPPGMMIDETGLVTWDAKDVVDGKYTAKVKISDKISTVLYRFDINLAGKPAASKTQ